MSNVISLDQARAPERNPPINVDVEQEVLAAILATPSALAQLQPILKPEYFAEQVHQVIYAAIIEIAEVEGLPTPGQLYQRLGPKVSATAITPEVSVKQYLARLAAVGGMPGHPLLTHAKVVRDLYILRHMEAQGVEIGQNQGYDPTAFLEELFEKQDELRALRSERDLKTTSLAGAGDALPGADSGGLEGRASRPSIIRNHIL